MKPLHRKKKKQGHVQVGQKASIQSAATIAEQAKANLGAPVCVVLKDGSYYYGVVADIEANQVILQGFKGDKKLRKKKGSSKAQISSLGGLGSMLGLLGGGGGLGSLFGGGSSGGLLGGLGKGAGATGGGSGIFGNIGSFMKLGMGVISFIMPLMKNFSI